jgi:hypothetical protein
MQKKDNFTHIVFGNSLASLVASLSLSKSKKNKIMLVNPKKFWGGHFHPIKINGHEFDVGMFLYEFTSLNKNMNLNPKRYNNIKFQNSQFFVNSVKGLVTKYFPTKKILPIQIFYKRKLYYDYLISNNISILKFINLKKKINQEINKINIKSLKKKKLHPSQKRYSQKFLSKSFNNISIRNHGKTFHNNFIEVFCKKTLYCSTKDVLARFHRVCWLPLYYPETLKDELNKKNKLKLFEFNYPIKELGTAVTKKLITDIKKKENIFINYGIDNMSFRFNKKFLFLNEKKILKKNFIFASDLIDFKKIKNIKIMNNFEKSSIGIIFIITDKKNLKKNFSVINFIDKEIGFYRIVNQTSLNLNKKKIKLSIEFNLDYLKHLSKNKNLKINSMISKNLKDIEIFHNIEKLNYEVKIFKETYMKPNKVNFRIYEKNYANVVRYLSKKNLIGPAAGFYKSSFNDQVIQGIKFE